MKNEFGQIEVTTWNLRQTAAHLRISVEKVRELIEAKRIVAFRGRGRNSWRVVPAMLAYMLEYRNQGGDNFLPPE